jgi:hypothetical protein
MVVSKNNVKFIVIIKKYCKIQLIIGIILSGLFFFAYFKKDIFIDYLIEKLEKGE